MDLDIDFALVNKNVLLFIFILFIILSFGKRLLVM